MPSRTFIAARVEDGFNRLLNRALIRREEVGEAGTAAAELLVA